MDSNQNLASFSKKKNHYLECLDQTYGLECQQNCGNCENKEPCNHVNGSCLNGCDSGYYGDKCNLGLTLTVVVLGFELLKVWHIASINFGNLCLILKTYYMCPCILISLFGETGLPQNQVHHQMVNI